MPAHILYGDGVHDDTDAIQELIDSGVCEVSLPAPEKYYLISKPLTIPSNFKLKLPRYATIKLADGANCFMLQNKTVSKPADRQREFIDPFEKAFGTIAMHFPRTRRTCATILRLKAAYGILTIRIRIPIRTIPKSWTSGIVWGM